MGEIEQGQSEGATLALGGKRVMTETGGCYLEPTVYDNVGHGMRIAQEEIFGPVLSTITFSDEAEALPIANNSPFGLAAAVWTPDINPAHRAARQLPAGRGWVYYWEDRKGVL